MNSANEGAVDRPIRVLILGGGFGGLECARHLKDDRFAVTLVDKRNHHLFQPLLYQVATAGLSAPEIAQPIRMLVRGQENVSVLMDEAVSINLAERRVELRQQTLGYDYLVMAMGVKTGYFGHGEWAEHAPGLKSLEDATRIRSGVLRAFERAESGVDPVSRERLMTMVVVGGGPTGVEMAGALAELSRKVLAEDFRRIRPETAHVILIEAGPRLLPTFAPDLSEYARVRLEKMGVQVRLDTRVQNIGDGLVELHNGRLEAETIVWAAGVEGNALTKNLPVPQDRAGRLLVRPDGSLPGFPEVFAVGDMISLTDKNGVKVPGVAPAASQLGRHVAGVILAELRHRERYHATQERAAFAYLDKGSMATIGRSSAVAAAFGLKFRGYLAWLMWLFVHLLFLVGFRNRIAVVLQWVYSYFTWRRGARIITREDVNVR
ncbi:MAG: FAD-dependent pyridine nucleotide-disulfide oxidoreductase [Verrucomicrobiales bacterium]|nr:FAD-dependent pyridine nucleotide-disulfide oxidoreductase [Verrucomicrobiales bacterium]